MVLLEPVLQLRPTQTSPRYREFSPIVHTSALFEMWTAYDTWQHMRVLLKSVNSRLVEGSAEWALATHSIDREANVLRHLHAHPRFSQLLEAFSHRGRPYLAIAYITGQTLADWCASCAPDDVSIDNVIGIGWQLGSLLHKLHTQMPVPIIHRDLKPPNLMVSAEGECNWLHLIDFGNARFLHAPQAHPSTEVRGRPTDTFPNTGTWGYFAPEQLLNPEVPLFTGTTTTASDIYSFGIVLHQLLSGEDPTLQKRESAFAFSPLSLRPRVPPHLARLVYAMLERVPANRPTAHEVCQSLALGG